MQKTIIKLLILTIVLSAALSASYLFAVWTGPTQSPPLGNTLPPINIGNINQVKDAGLAVNALAVFGEGYFQGSVQVGDDTNACSSAKRGAMRYNNTTGCIEYCDGVNLAWASVDAACPFVAPPPITCVSGSRDFLTPGEFSLAVDDNMKECKFSFTIKGGGGAQSGGQPGGNGGGIIISDILVPQTGSHSFGILVGAKGWGDGSGRIAFGGGAAGDYGSGGGGSAVKLDSTVLAISGGGGAASYYISGGNGGSGNSPGKNGSGNNPGYGGYNGIGGNAGAVGANGGNAGNSGGDSVGKGGEGYPTFMIGGGGGGGNSSSNYGTGGGGGFGGGGGSGATSDGYSGAGGGGGYLGNVSTFQIISVSNSEQDGSVTVSWSK